MILSYQEALDQTQAGKRHVLLGNGFSIAWGTKIFIYESIFEQADFSKILNAAALFGAAGSNDFEIVIRGLQRSAKFVRVYKPDETTIPERMLEDAAKLKEILVQAIAENHPALPSEIKSQAYVACRKFLSSFTRIYTVNYDLLLYWTLMQDEFDELDIPCDDGFRNPDGNGDSDYVSWEDPQSAKVHFLHGALHLFDSGTELKKYTWLRTGVPLIEQIRAALSQQLFPLFVAEGDTYMKLERINHSAYLHKAFRSFSSISGDLFIYGHSLAANDDHILRRIEKGRIRHVYISIFGDPGSSENKRIMERGLRMVGKRWARRRHNPLEVAFYRAESAMVWNSV